MAASPVQAQRPAIPAQFHGRWAPTPRACANRGPDSQAVQVNARGWLGFEEGSRVIGRLQPRAGAHRFRVVSFAGADDHAGILALRITGGRLMLTETVDGRTNRQSLHRCRR